MMTPLQQDPFPAGLYKFIEEKVHWLRQFEAISHHPPAYQKKTCLATQTHAFYCSLYETFLQAKVILKREFDRQDQAHEQHPKSASFEVFEASLHSLKPKNVKKHTPSLSPQSPMEQLGLSWEFMDRVYEIASNLFEQRAYSESRALFLLLTNLHPLVASYWLVSAHIDLAIKTPQEALEKYLICLILEPNNLSCLHHCVHCLYEMKEIKACLAMLKWAKEITPKNNEDQRLIEKTHAIELFLENELQSQKQRVAS